MKNLPLSLFAFAALSVTLLVGTQAEQTRPNVLIVLTDDQGWGDISSHGNDKIETPAMDRLASEGARFDRFHVSPVCAPTRASLLTGRYHLRTGVSGVTHRKEVMLAEEITLAEIFSEAGYATGCFGKWHNGLQAPTDPNGQGFDEFFGVLGGGCMEYFDCPELRHNRKPVPPEEAKGFITDVLTDRTIGFVQDQKESPWLCYVAYNAPHTPCQVPDRYFEKYRERGFNEMDATVYGMIENIDDNLARLLDALEKTGQSQHTIVVFFTDNGPNSQRFNGDMKGKKATIHEGGTRVPWFIRYPGQIVPGTTIRPNCAHIDLLPTLASFCGIPHPDPGSLDGIDLVPLLTGTADALAERSLFFHQSRRNRGNYLGAVRTSRWRAERIKNRWQLFDMIADPSQKNDLAEGLPDVLREFAGQHERWLEEVTRDLVGRPPIPVGHAELTELRTPESFQEGDLGWPNGPGFTTEWIRQWRSKKDRIWWELDVKEEGDYEVSMVYACPASQVGSRLRIECGDATLEANLDTAFEGNLRRRSDRRSDENWMQCDFTTQKLGSIRIPAGRQKLTIRAIEIPAEEVAEFRGLILKQM